MTIGTSNEEQEQLAEVLKLSTSQVKINKPAGTRKKKLLEDPSQISALVPLYSVVADIRDKLANITIEQLLRSVPSM